MYRRYGSLFIVIVFTLALIGCNKTDIPKGAHKIEQSKPIVGAEISLEFLDPQMQLDRNVVATITALRDNVKGTVMEDENLKEDIMKNLDALESVVNDMPVIEDNGTMYIDMSGDTVQSYVAKVRNNMEEFNKYLK